MNTTDRVMARVDISGGVDSCHPWTGPRDQEGRGRVAIDGRQWIVPRWLLGRARGEHLAHGELACHHCDNPSCCNVRHLYVGDHAVNGADMSRRARHPGQRKTHCVNGHEFTAANTYRRPGTLAGRDCRACIRARAAHYKQRARSA